MGKTKVTTKQPAAASASAERQLRSFVAKFEPKRQILIRSIRRAMQRRLPSANELVYDNYNFFVIGYGPNERPSDAILSIAAGASGVSLCFIRGAMLPDPAKILQGSGKQTRFVRLPTAAALEEPAVVGLIAAAVADSRVPFPARGRGRLIIRSISTKQRPRRKESSRTS
jgi:hypothetical protein